MTSEKIIEGEAKEVVNDNGAMSNEELDSLLSDSGEEDEFKTEFIDERMQVVTRARSLIMYWQQLHQQISQIREGYSLAKLWEDEELKTQHMEQGRPLLKKEKILNEVVRDVLTELKDIPFLTQTEMVQLPKWMLKILNVRIDTDSTPPESLLSEEEETDTPIVKTPF
jgi:hypothetical protein